MQLVILGPPGSGKGTLAADLVKIYQIPHISTGDIFRKMIKEKTPMGLKAQSYISQGLLVPDDVTIEMVRQRLQADDCAEGFMLDGFPRTIVQAEALDHIMKKAGKKISAVLNVIVSDDLILYRLSGRRICSGCGKGYNTHTMPPQKAGICDDCGEKLLQRDDDKEETVKERLETYRRQTKPLIEYYQKRKLVVPVDNSGKPGENTEDVRNDLKNFAESGNT